MPLLESSSPDRPLPKLRFFILTTRNSKTDFRLPLVKALQRNYETWHIWLKRRPQVLSPPPSAGLPSGANPVSGQASAAIVPVELSFPSMLRLMRRVATDDAINIYLDSTSAAYLAMLPAMHWICRRGIWIHDMHDDLLYDHAGWVRFRLGLSIRLQEFLADFTVRAADSLKELFPRSKHLGNASQIVPLIRQTPDDFRRVLILASLDQRFDFNLMSAVAAGCPDHDFYIHGQISQGDTAIRRALDDLLKAHDNIHHHGPYDLGDLEEILKRYAVTLAPYRTDIRLTRYIDPLRFYHCLNSGMEVITSRIPQAEQWHRTVHLVTSAADVAAALQALAEARSNRRNTPENYQVQRWEDRADQLVRMVWDHLPEAKQPRNQPSFQS